MTNIDSIKKQKQKQKQQLRHHSADQSSYNQSHGAQTVRNTLAIWETWVRSWEGDPCSPVEILGAPKLGCPSSSPGRGIRSHILQLKMPHVTIKIPAPTCYNED